MLYLVGRNIFGLRVLRIQKDTLNDVLFDDQSYLIWCSDNMNAPLFARTACHVWVRFCFLLTLMRHFISMYWFPFQGSGTYHLNVLLPPILASVGFVLLCWMTKSSISLGGVRLISISWPSDFVFCLTYSAFGFLLLQRSFRDCLPHNSHK